MAEDTDRPFETLAWSVRWSVPQMIWERWLSPRDWYRLWDWEYRLEKRRRALGEIVAILELRGGDV